MAKIRILRVVEYVGEEADVVRQVSYSIDGTTCVGSTNNGKVQITAATLSESTVQAVKESEHGQWAIDELIDKPLNEARQKGTGPGSPRVLIEYKP